MQVVILNPVPNRKSLIGRWCQGYFSPSFLENLLFPDSIMITNISGWLNPGTVKTSRIPAAGLGTVGAFTGNVGVEAFCVEY